MDSPQPNREAADSPQEARAANSPQPAREAADSLQQAQTENSPQPAREAADSLQQARTEIDRIDAELARLFEARMAAAAKIAACKQAKGLPIRDPAREAEVLSRNTARITEPALRAHYAALLERLMECARNYQAELLQTEPPALHLPSAQDVPLSCAAERCLCPALALPTAVAAKPALELRTAEGTNPVFLRRGVLSEAGRLLDLNRRVLLVTDAGVPSEYAETLARLCAQSRVYTAPQGEAGKSPAVLFDLLKAMQDFGLTRSDCLLAVGGGAVGDLGGLAAAVYMRGIDWYNCPTTTLSMVDSSIGGKTAVNLGGIKNAVGAFHQPRAVLIDPTVLETLPRRQAVSGLVEAIKMGLTHDPALFARFEGTAGEAPIAARIPCAENPQARRDPADDTAIEELIAAALRVKQAVVEADPREAGLRRALNFGHSLGHGVEAATDGALLHGECVGLGMLPLCAPAVRARLCAVLERLGLPTGLQGLQIDPERLLAAVLHDKKLHTDGSITLVTVPEVGRFKLQSLSPKALRELCLQLLRTGAASAPAFPEF